MPGTQKYKPAAGLKSVGGIKVVRGFVEMTPAAALYHLAIGRISDPSKQKKVDTPEDTSEEEGG